MTPRTKEQNEDIRLRRLVQIRKAAADVFLNKGPLLEIRDVAAEAGLGYGTVYHYYSNKGDLLHDLLWDALDRAAEWLKSPPMAEPELPLKIPLESSAAGVRLLQLWAEDHAIYLLCKQAGEDSLPCLKPALPAHCRVPPGGADPAVHDAWHRTYGELTDSWRDGRRRAA